MVAVSEWPPAMVDALGRHRTNHLSCSECAYALAEEFRDWPKRISRNVVIGKVHRLRAKFPEDERWKADSRNPNVRKAAKRPQGLSRTDRRAREIINKAAVTTISKVPQEPQYFPNSFEPFEGCEPKSLMDLKPGQCKWPVDVEGATLQMFCGQSSDTTYCVRHGGTTGGRRK